MHQEICAWTVRLKGHDRRALVKVFTNKSVYALAVLVVSVMVFQRTLDDIGAAEKIAEELRDLRVPVVLVVAILPFIAGLVTGLAIGFVGTSFPLVLALVAGEPGSIRPYVALAYGFGHLGQMMSPLHLCHVVSNEYFRTTFMPVYRQFLPSAALAATLVGAYFLLLRIVL